MEFASIAFIWAFLPIVLALYYACRLLRTEGLRNQAGNLLLLLASFFFYAYGGFKTLLLLLAIISLNFGAGLWMDSFADGKTNFQKKRKAVFLAALLGNLGILVSFKYFNYVLNLTKAVSKSQGLAMRSFFQVLFRMEGLGPVQRVAMPLALSFVLFQSISYLADVYSRKTAAERNPLAFFLYISFFAKLVQGPIMRYGDLGNQIRMRTHSMGKFVSGVRLFCFGLGKKVLLANTLAKVADGVWGTEFATMSSATAWIGILFYTLQIYYNFSGYSDMAIGVGRMFGFEICPNFDYPYTSLSIQEFWRRWHMSLSSWFRDYVYIPLGGSRKGKGRTLINLFIVFLVTGIWHGANPNFLLWGLYFAGFSLIERLFLGKWLRKNPIKLLNGLYTILVVMMGWALFRAPSLSKAVEYFKALFSFRESTGIPVISWLNVEAWLALIAGLLLSGWLQRALAPIYERVKNSLLFMSADALAQFGILICSIVMLASGSYNPSIYAAF